MVASTGGTPTSAVDGAEACMPSEHRRLHDEAALLMSLSSQTSPSGSSPTVPQLGERPSASDRVPSKTAPEFVVQEEPARGLLLLTAAGTDRECSGLKRARAVCGQECPNVHSTRRPPRPPLLRSGAGNIRWNRAASGAPPHASSPPTPTTHSLVVEAVQRSVPDGGQSGLKRPRRPAWPSGAGISARLIQSVNLRSPIHAIHSQSQGKGPPLGCGTSVPATCDEQPRTDCLALSKRRQRRPSDVAQPAASFSKDPNTGFWRTEDFFPGQGGDVAIKDPLDHGSVQAVRQYDCRSTRCEHGGCCSKITELEVLQVRQQCNNGRATSSSDTARLMAVVRAARDSGVKGGYQTVKIDMAYSNPVHVCLPAWALIAGYTGSAFKKALADVAKEPLGYSAPPPLLLAPREQEKLQTGLVRSYIHNVLCAAHEQQPVAALGSTNGRETVVYKQSWNVMTDRSNTTVEH